MPDGERGARVLAEVELLERHRIRPVAADQLVELRVNVGEPALGRRAGGGADHAPVQSHELVSSACDHAVARVGDTGVHAQDDHVQGFCARRRTPACLCPSG